MTNKKPVFIIQEKINIMKGLFTSLFIVVAMLVSIQASAQTSLYSQNFDGSSSLPAGWYASANSWFNDTTLGNISTGYHGASGSNNIAIKDTTGRLGLDSLITGAISTVGYDNIAVEWGTRFSKHFADSGSTVSLYWSVDGTTWTNVSYVENANNSNWELENDSTPIMLPSGAANQAALWLMWVADIHFTPSGTYRIDDLNITGTALTGINNISSNEDFAKIYTTSNSEINVSVKQPVTESLHVEVYDLSGRVVMKANMNTQSLSIDAHTVAGGLYLVKVSDSDHSVVTKVVLK
jgi:hypothetical protein